MEVGNILSIVSLLIALVGGAVLKVLISRSFKSTDDAINRIRKRIEDSSLDESVKNNEKEIIRLQGAVEATQGLKDTLRAEFLEKFQLKSDFIREVSSTVEQIESLHNKIDAINSRLLNGITKKR